MNPYDFSCIEFSDPEIAAELAQVYALLLERARCRKAQQSNPDVSGSTVTGKQVGTGHTAQSTYVQTDMFSGEVRNDR
jgi:hypothetical protein